MKIKRLFTLASFLCIITAMITGMSTDAVAVDQSCPANKTLRAQRLGGEAPASSHATPCRLTKCRWVGSEAVKYAAPRPFDPLPVYWRYRAVAGTTPTNYCSGDVNGSSSWPQ